MSSIISIQDEFTGQLTTATTLSMLLAALNAGDNILVDGTPAQIGESGSGTTRNWIVNGLPPEAYYGVTVTPKPPTPTNGTPPPPGAAADNSTMYLLIAGAVVLWYLSR
jgi:hypothetical protein